MDNIIDLPDERGDVLASQSLSAFGECTFCPVLHTAYLNLVPGTD